MDVVLADELPERDALKAAHHQLVQEACRIKLLRLTPVLVLTRHGAVHGNTAMAEEMAGLPRGGLSIARE